MSQLEDPADAAIAEEKQRVQSLLGGPPVVMPAFLSSSPTEKTYPMSPGDAGELWEQATRLAAIYRQPVEVVLRDLQTVLEWDYKLRNSPPEESDGPS